MAYLFEEVTASRHKNLQEPLVPLVFETSVKEEALIITDELACPALPPSWLLEEAPSGYRLISQRLSSSQG